MGWVKARVFVPEQCDPDVPFSCAPTLEVEGAAELQVLTEQHGIGFEEPSDPDDPIEELEVEESMGTEELEVVSQETRWPALVCPVDPDEKWDDSLCRGLTGLSEDAIWLIREAITQQDEGGT